ncbi:MAG: hypothetical protein ACQ9IQ_10670 [Nitrospirales bacterium]
MPNSQDKILVIQGGPPELIVHPEVLSLGNCIQVSPLPDLEDVETLIKGCECKECRKKSIRLIAYEISERLGGVLGRCKKCRELFWVFFSQERLWSADLLICIGSSKSKFYREQLIDLKCKKCSSKMEVQFKKSDNEFDFLMILPMLVVCRKIGCGCKMNVIFWDTPKSYFQLALGLAEEVIPHSPRAALVFVVSALETYLQKAFMFHSLQNKYLVQKRKVSFQSLKDSNENFKQFMDVDLKPIISNPEWEALANSITKRHGLIHNAGLDRDFEEIIVDEKEIEPLKALVTKFVEGANAKLEKDGIL